MEVMYNGKKNIVNILGGFKIEELNKEYVMCTFDSDLSSDKVSVVILETETIDNEIYLKDIEEEETEMVLLFYNRMKEESLSEGEQYE